MKWQWVGLIVAYFITGISAGIMVLITGIRARKIHENEGGVAFGVLAIFAFAWPIFVLSSLWGSSYKSLVKFILKQKGNKL